MDNTQDEAWLAFAAMVLFVAGFMRIFDAIWAFRYHGELPQGLEGAIFGHSLKTYGWIDLVVAAIMFGSAFLVLRRSQIARWVGVVAGAILAISAVWWIPYYPIWSLMYVGLGVLLIYALIAHGAATGRKVELLS